MRLGPIVLLKSAPLALVHETRAQVGRDDVAVDDLQGVLGESPDSIPRLPGVKIGRSGHMSIIIVLLLAGLRDVAVAAVEGFQGDTSSSKPRLRCVQSLFVFDATVCISRPLSLKLSLKLSSSGHLPVVLLLAGLSNVAVDPHQGVLSKSLRGIPRLSGIHWLSVVGVTTGHGGGR
jgi:hypothetical protein